uniref:Nudix hydrolase domain-containing protein n=1 Tax=viral metagenome TaxID=1070528 RepID=A0A6C0BBD0_9ZZZZ
MLAAFLLGLFVAEGYQGAGVQLFKQNEVLLVQGFRSGKWGFPKGHRELSDLDWKSVALREVKEETGYVYGIDYALCDDQVARWGSRLYWRGGMLTDRGPTHNVTEHRGVQWFPKEKMEGLRVTKDVEEWMHFDYTVCAVEKIGAVGVQ